LAGSDQNRDEEQLILVDETHSTAGAASPAPPTEKSRSPLAFNRRIASGSNSRSVRVRALAAADSVLE
jgi:hypothetical protein